MSPKTSYLGGAFETHRFLLGGGEPPSPAPLPAPASAENVSSAEKALGFALSGDLIQLYRQVANGGFGPADGLASLETIVGRYRDLIDVPPSEPVAKWPEHLLPIGLAEPGTECYDLRSGRIVYAELDGAVDRRGNEKWTYSFRTEADSLQAWLEAWLSIPPLAQQLKQQMEESLTENIRTTLAYWRAKSPQERAEFGLPEEGWEQALFGHLGVDLTGL